MAVDIVCPMFSVKCLAILRTLGRPFSLENGATKTSFMSLIFTAFPHLSDVEVEPLDLLIPTKRSG